MFCSEARRAGLEMHLDGAKPFTKQDVIDTMKSYDVLGASQNTGPTLFYDGLVWSSSHQLKIADKKSIIGPRFN